MFLSQIRFLLQSSEVKSSTPFVSNCSFIKMLDICSASNFRLAWDVAWFNNVCVSRCFAVL